MNDAVSNHEIKSEGSNKAGTKRLSSVTNAIHLLKAFSPEDPELGISELARRLGVAKSTIHRLATALASEGLLQQNPDSGRYYLGLELFSLGAQVRSRLSVTSETKIILNQLRDITQENVRLGVFDGLNVVYLHDFESPHAVRLRSTTGESRPAFCTAEGLCLLSDLGEPEISEFLKHPRERRTEKTIIDEQSIRTRIRLIERRGYAIEEEECEEGTRCIAAPVFSHSKRMIAAVGVVGPRLRLKKSQYPDIFPQVLSAAAQLTKKLGNPSLDHSF
ncbi:MAG: IclR family transcriptional regulator [Gammaproteobacteria bacterium]|nr:IclR family transcriptional regulator [Gammaproteobacteria bacterium]